MSSKITIECDARFEKGVRRALAMLEEMEQLALTAPDGQVFDQCEQAVIDKGRNFQAATLGEAVARRVEAAEKKGPRSDSVTAVARKKTAAPSHGDS
jgi:DNA replication initiation complex subunit (GINS family)